MLATINKDLKIREFDARKLLNFFIDKGIIAFFESSYDRCIHSDINERMFLINIVTTAAKARKDMALSMGGDFLLPNHSIC